ncbi:MAG: exopolysaccharide biosynthesis GT4 family glycosyltransferase EpsE [Tepidisphaeraceae bacterium]|jgi:glycosyltransferase involved in cell wall biosynthesis
MQRLGYLVPEFPGQTHVFFWRELQSLAQLGVLCDLVSTRRPPRQLVTHDWSAQAMQRTTYLSPPELGLLASALWELIRAGPAAWWRCAGAAMRADVRGAGNKIRLLALVFVGAELAALARRRNWAHVHVHSAADSANIALFAHLIGRISYSLALHGPLEDYGPNQRAKWSHAAFGIVITQKLLEQLRTGLAGALPPVIDLAPMGVDASGFRRAGPYQPWDGRGPFRIFCCGRLNPCKGHDDLIRAVALLRQEGIDAILRIAGADDSLGRYQPVLENLIRQLKLDAAVTLLGAVPEQTVRDELQASHVFALASLHEPLGVALMEAMSMSTPVVATGAGGVPELVDDQVDGLLVEPRHPQQLAAALTRLARDGALATRLAEAARKKIEASFQSDQSARVLVRRLQSLHPRMIHAD